MTAYTTTATRPALPKRSPVPVLVHHVISLFVLLACLARVGFIGAQWLNAGLVEDHLGRKAIRADEVSDYIGLMQNLAFAGLGLVLCAGFATMYWCSMSRDDAVRRGTYPQRHSAGWAAGGWAVPFAALVIPFQVVGDIWKANEPRADRERREAKADTDPGPSALIWWWGLWIVTGSASCLTLRAASDPLTERPNVLELALTATFCATGFLFIHILRRVTAWQQTEPERPPDRDGSS